MIALLVLLDTTVTLTGEGELSEGRLGQPVSLAVDIEHDVIERLALSLVHSSYATTNMRASAGGGLCVHGNIECNSTYNNAGAEAHYTLRDDLRLTGGLHLLDIGALDVGVKLAARAERRLGRFTLYTHPTVMIPDRAWLPIGVDARPASGLVLGVQTGVTAAFDALDAWELPLTGTIAWESRHVTAGIAFTWYKLASGVDQPANRAPIDGFDYRIAQLWLAVTW